MRALSRNTSRMRALSPRRAPSMYRCNVVVIASQAAKLASSSDVVTVAVIFPGSANIGLHGLRLCPTTRGHVLANHAVRRLVAAIVCFCFASIGLYMPKLELDL